MSTPDASRLLDDLDPEQRAVAEALHGPVVVVAGAGTGKTRAITRRIAYGVAIGAYDAAGVLALTFTTRAATEMRRRLGALGVPGVTTRTFHAAALAQVRYFWPRLYGRSFPDLHADPAGLLAGLMTASGVAASARDVATEIAWAKVSNVPAHRYVERAAQAQRRVPSASARDVARLYTSYVDALERADQVDMEDVLLAAVGLLRTQPAAARVVRQRYRWLTVDECQDVSPLQMALVQCWLGDRDELCVVGDPRQSIYAFAGARADLLTGLTSQYPRATRIDLIRNYRSTPQVLAVAEAVLATGTASRESLPAVRATRPDGPRVRIVEVEDQRGEAAEVQRLVSTLLEQGLPEHAVAVLTRTQAHAAVLARALVHVGVPVSTPGAAAFYERREVQQAIALLSAASRRHESSGQAPGPAGAAESARQVLRDAGWNDKAAPAERASARWQGWAAVIAVADDLDRRAGLGSSRGLADLVDELRTQERAGQEPSRTGVVVETLHATKGQQWPAVIIAGAHDGGLPLWTAVGRSAPSWAEDEERRLLYVGVTRAREHLAITWARHPTPGAPRRRPSRFLQGLLAEPVPAADIQLRPAPAGT